MRTHTFTLIFVCAAWMATSQTLELDKGKVGADNNDIGYGGSLITSKPLGSFPTEGTIFLSDIWLEANLITYDEKNINDLQIKYNQLDDNILVKQETKVIILNPTNIKSFNLYDPVSQEKRFFYNAQEFDSDYVEGFAELVYKDDKLTVISETEITVSEATYDPRFDTGTRTNEYIRTNKYILDLPRDETVVVEKRKDLYFGPFEGKGKKKIKRFIKSNDLDINYYKDMKEIAEFISKSI